MKATYLSMVSLCLLGLCSCFDMDKYPEGRELSSVNSFTSTTEITKYLNQFYESTLKLMTKMWQPAIKEQFNSIGNPTVSPLETLNSDNMQSNVIDTRLAGENHIKFRCRINRV